MRAVGPDKKFVSWVFLLESHKKGHSRSKRRNREDILEAISGKKFL